MRSVCFASFLLYYTILLLTHPLYIAINIISMNKPSQQETISNPLLGVIRSVIGKLRQNPEVYPIRYYKKGKQFRRKWQGPLVK